MMIIKYKNYGDITVEFQDKYRYTTNTTYQNFKRGSIINPYSRSIYGVGYIGEGQYQTHDGVKNIEPYITWKDMISRCYNENQRHKHLAYADCIICEEWINYQNFAQWYVDNYYNIDDGGRMHLDKDILVKDNKEYTPDKCLFVPQRINMIFMKKAKSVDSDLPTGIRRCVGGFYVTYNGKYQGIYKTLEESINVYNTEKRIHILNVANEYKDKIPNKVYEALINW